MSVPLNVLIPVTGTVVNPGFTGITTAMTVLTTNQLIPSNATQSVLQFNSLALVGAYFGLNSNEYACAVNYFQSSTIASITPPFINFALYVNAATAPYTRGGSGPVLATLQGITSGSLIVNFEGAPTTISSVNLSSETSLSDIATSIQGLLIIAGLTDATCTYNSLTNAFQISDGVNGDTVAYCGSSSLAAAMLLEQANGAILSQGHSAALSPAVNMNNIIAITTNWTSFTNLFANDTSPYATQIGLANWAVSQNNQYVYVLWDNEVNLTTEVNTGSVAAGLVTAGLGTYVSNQITYNVPISPWYGTVNLATFIGGMGASIAWNQLNSTISFASKTQAGLPASVTSLIAYDNVLANGFNCYAQFNSQAQSYTFTENGSIGGIYVYLDNFYNQVWLANQLQNAVANMFASNGKLPNNSAGYQILKATLDAAMQAAVFNGTAQPGNTFTGTEAATLKQQAGYDITPTLTAQGYVIQIVPVTPSQRATRTPPVTNIWYSNGGSINTLPINLIYVF